MDDRDALVEAEAIKRLKARYCRDLDAKNWESWRQIFTDDFRSDTSESGGKIIEGADAFVAFVRKPLNKPSRITVHQVHAPEIEVTSATTAHGVWALADLVRLAPGLTFAGHGHYHETYEKTESGWRISSSRLSRLRQDLHFPFLTVGVPGRRSSRSRGQSS